MTGARGRARAGRRRAAACALAVLAVGAAGCASAPDSGSGLRAWASAAGYSSSLALLRSDVAEIATGARLLELKATRTACDGLGVDAANAIGQLPTPDHRLSDALNRAYSSLLNAAQSCSTARSLSSKAFARYRSGAARGLAELAAADRQLRRLEAR